VACISAAGQKVQNEKNGGGLRIMMLSFLLQIQAGLLRHKSFGLAKARLADLV